MGKMRYLRDFSVVRLLVPDVVVPASQKQLCSWDFNTQQSAINKKHPVSGSSMAKNALLMREVRGEWADYFKLAQRPEIIKHFLIN